MTKEQIKKIYEVLKESALALSEQSYNRVDGDSTLALATVVQTLMKMEEHYPFC